MTATSAAAMNSMTAGTPVSRTGSWGALEPSRHRERSRRCQGDDTLREVVALNNRGIYTVSLHTKARSSRGAMIIPKLHFLFLFFANIWRMTPPCGHSLENNASLLSSPPGNTAISWGNILDLEEKYSEYDPVSFPSPNNTFTLWSPKCLLFFFVYLRILEFLQQHLGTACT